MIDTFSQRCSSSDAQYAVSRFSNGDPYDISNDAMPAVVSFNYADRGQGSPSSLANASNVKDVGPVWGLAFDRPSGHLYMSTLLKRHAGLTESGGSPLIGAIYRQTDITDASTSSLFYDFGTAAGNDIPNNATRFPDLGGLEGPANTERSLDATVYSMIGKRGFGDIDLSRDGQTLYVTNLFDRKLYTLDTTTPSHVEVASAPWLDNSICPTNADSSASGVARPWAVKYHEDQVYVGVVCDGSSSDSCDATNACSDLTAHVFAHDGVNWSTVLPTPVALDYERDLQGYSTAGEFWHPWTDNYAAIQSYMTGGIKKYPQPILGDIEFDDDGSIILGMIDRTTHQFGFRNSEPNVASANTNIYVFSAGDVLRVGFDATGTTLTLESNGQVYNSSGGLLTGVSTASPAGPGGREFYDDQWNGSGFATASADATIGSLALLPDSGEMLYTGADRYSYYSAAVSFASNTDGSHTGGVTVYQDDSSGGAGTFSKGGGLGDIEILCPTIDLPLEVGNRIWSDDDADGVQDADELGIENVSVQLVCGAQTASTTTDANGQYLFTDGAGDIATWTDGVIPRDTDCEVRVADADAALAGKELTDADQAGANDSVDSDATSSGGNAIVSFRAGDAGQNNHTYDIGYRDVPACSITQPTVSSQCDDNGTPSDDTDDRFSYTINVTGTNAGATYSISGGDTQANLPYEADQAGLGDFPIAGGDITLSITDDTTPSCTLNNVTVTAPATCSNVVPQVDLEVVKTASQSSVVSGDAIAYTITITNNGPGNATGIEVTDQLPTGVTYVSDTPSQGSYTQGTGVWTVGDLANGANAMLTIEASVD